MWARGIETGKRKGGKKNQKDNRKKKGASGEGKESLQLTRN